MIVGGGLAGIAAALEASRHGGRVLLLESLSRLGGRAASFSFRGDRAPVDAGAHLLLDACSQLRELHEELGLTRFFERQSGVRFLLPEGRFVRFAAWPALPGLLKFLPSLLTFPALSFSEKAALARLIRSLAGRRDPTRPDESFGDFLARNGSPERTDALFWHPITLSALVELPECVAASAARKVIREGLFAGRTGPHLTIPARPLSEIYDRPVRAELQKRGVSVRCGTRVVRLYVQNKRVVALRTAAGETISCDRLILAIPPRPLAALLSDSGMETVVQTLGLDRFVSGAITAVHLRFDRRLIPEIAAVLTCAPPVKSGPNKGKGKASEVGQWLFCPRECGAFGLRFGADTPTDPSASGVYHQVLISGSHRLLPPEERRPEALVPRVIAQLQRLLSEARFASLLSSRVTTVPNAVWLPTPELFAHRPANRVALFENLTVAGDWTDTGWPATLEGAVRSGRTAAEEIGT